MTLTASATIGDRFAAGSGRFPLSGVQALIRLIVDVRRADRAQGLDTAAFVSGYEGSPLAAWTWSCSAVSSCLPSTTSCSARR